MIKYVLVSTVFLLIFTANAKNLQAQGICVAAEISTAKIRGFVELPNKLPVSGASIAVLKSNKNKSLVKNIIADEKGFFEITGLKSGKYYVNISYPTLVPMQLLIRFSKRYKDNTKNIYITLNGLIGEPCGGGYVGRKEVEK
jgi:Carboxypeptidase regulatory-like domain